MIKRVFMPYLLLLCLAGCAKRNFYPDEDDPGLSRFTSYGYNVVTNYINGKPYINPFFLTSGNILPVITKISTNDPMDTLSIYWQIELEDTLRDFLSPYQYLYLSLPVPKTFTKNDFLHLSNKRLINTCNISLAAGLLPFYFPRTGLANIYFVKIEEDSVANLTPNLGKYLKISGLFSGIINDTILVTKGRFDFKIYESGLNF